MTLPRLGDTADIVTVLQWLVSEGQAVAADDAVLLVETDKANIEIPTPVAGVLVSRLVGDGDEVRTGTPVFVVEAAVASASDARSGVGRV